MSSNKYFKSLFLIVIFLSFGPLIWAQNTKAKFRVIAFYTAKNDKAHISFVHEANRWFPKMATKYGFKYDSTSNWTNLNIQFLKNYNVVLFLDTRPEDKSQRKAFETYMKNGGGWMGFHFAAFAMDKSAYPQNWDWYHDEFLGTGQYVSNTWQPTPANLKVEDRKYTFTKHLPQTINTSPNEWYRWQRDLRNNADIDILLSIDSTSFPLGTGPKQSEIWHSGFYPVVWTNRNYHMVYFNMGHNSMDYGDKGDRDLSHTFDSPDERDLILNALLWLGNSKPKLNGVK